MLKVLFCGLRYEYGKPQAGLSFEYQNFYESLAQMEGVQAEFFGFDEVMAGQGRDKMNQMLVGRIQETKPDLLFCFLFTNEIKKETIEYITKRTSTKTFNWFADDHWRFHVFSKFWAPLFTAVGTTDSKAYLKYGKLGISNVVHTQWAVNPKLYHPQPLPVGQENPYEITFVGQNYGVRQKYISALQTAGLPVVAYGTGWPTGRIPKEQSAVIWSNSGINLNFTESNYHTWKAYAKLLAKLFVKKELGRYKLNFHQIHNNIRSVFSVTRPQIKSRNFEIPGCGGFLITGDADNLSDYFEPGKEIIIFRGTNDLIEKCRYYMDYPEEAKRIAQAGHERTVREHTYEQRFRKIFEFLNL